MVCLLDLSFGRHSRKQAAMNWRISSGNKKPEGSGHPDPSGGWSITMGFISMPTVNVSSQSIKPCFFRK